MTRGGEELGRPGMGEGSNDWISFPTPTRGGSSVRDGLVALLAGEYSHAPEIYSAVAVTPPTSTAMGTGGAGEIICVA